MAGREILFGPRTIYTTPTRIFQREVAFRIFLAACHRTFMDTSGLPDSAGREAANLRATITSRAGNDPSPSAHLEIGNILLWAWLGGVGLGGSGSRCAQLSSQALVAEDTSGGRHCLRTGCEWSAGPHVRHAQEYSQGFSRPPVFLVIRIFGPIIFLYKIDTKNVFFTCMWYMWLALQNNDESCAANKADCDSPEWHDLTGNEQARFVSSPILFRQFINYHSATLFLNYYYQISERKICSPPGSWMSSSFRFPLWPCQAECNQIQGVLAEVIFISAFEF